MNKMPGIEKNDNSVCECGITLLAMVTQDKCLHRWFVKLTNSESSKL